MGQDSLQFANRNDSSMVEKQFSLFPLLCFFLNSPGNYKENDIVSHKS